MMFSDYVNAIRGLFNLPVEAFIPLLFFSLVFFFGWKLFRALVLRGHWFILVIVTIAVYLAASKMMQEGQYLLALIASIPLLFTGREGYRRLL